MILGRLGPAHHNRATAIGHKAAVAHPQRVGNRPRGDDILARQRIAHESVGVLLGPGPGRHRHVGQLFARCAELRHVTVCGQRIGRQREQRSVGGLVGRQAKRSHQLARGGALVRSVADQHGISEPQFEQHRGPERVRQERRAAHAVVHREPGVQAQFLRQCKTRQHIQRLAGGNGIDLAKCDPRIGKRAVHPLDCDLHRAFAMGLAAACQRCTDDGGFSP